MLTELELKFIDKALNAAQAAVADALSGEHLVRRMPADADDFSTVFCVSGNGRPHKYRITITEVITDPFNC